MAEDDRVDLKVAESRSWKLSRLEEVRLEALSILEINTAMRLLSNMYTVW